VVNTPALTFVIWEIVNPASGLAWNQFSVLVVAQNLIHRLDATNRYHRAASLVVKRKIVDILALCLPPCLVPIQAFCNCGKQHKTDIMCKLGSFSCG